MFYRLEGWQGEEELADQSALCASGVWGTSAVQISYEGLTVCGRKQDSGQEFKECMEVIEEQLRDSNGMRLGLSATQIWTLKV